jgi:hypothetical protein
MKRAQSTQVYVIIGVIFFFGIVLGFKLIYDFIETSSDVRLMEFNARLSADAQEIGNKPGSVQRYTYNIPYQTDQGCFYDPSATYAGIIPDHPVMKSMMEEGNNIFMVGGFKIKGVKVENIRAPTSYYCVNASRNTVTLFLEGGGGKATIKKSD